MLHVFAFIGAWCVCGVLVLLTWVAVRECAERRELRRRPPAPVHPLHHPTVRVSAPDPAAAWATLTDRRPA